MTTENAPGAPLSAGVIGLGMIGGGVAISLAKSGTPAAAVYDVRDGVSDGLEGVPAQSASVAEVAEQAEVVLLAVNTGDQAREVVSGEGGLLSAAKAGQIVVLLSTVSLSVVRELSAACAEHGVTLLDAGVTNGNAAAENGLVTMVGGPDEAVARAMPVLEAFSATVVHCGGLGAGMTTKLARNAITYSIWTAVREAAGLAAAGGVHPKTLLEVIKASGETVPPWLHLELLAVDYKIGEEQATWATDLALKDLAAAQELAADIGMDLPIVDVVRPRIGQVYAGELDQPGD